MAQKCCQDKHVKLERPQRVQSVRATSTSLLHSSGEQMRMKIKHKEKNNAPLNTGLTQTNTQNVHASYSNADKKKIKGRRAV